MIHQIDEIDPNEEIFVKTPNNQMTSMPKSMLPKYLQIIELLQDGVMETEEYPRELMEHLKALYLD